MAHILTKSDELIQRDVERELKWDTRVDEADVGVIVEHRIVKLIGTVASAVERQAALNAALRVAGVHDVVNELEVKLPASAVRTDDHIAEAVRHALTWDVYLDEDRIQSTVANGWVTLQGEVASREQANDAAAAVRRLIGVRGVISELRVQQPAVPPAEIKRAIEEALERRTARELDRIKVEVHGGEVTLRGTVNSWVEERDAVGAAGHARGVHTVHDELRVAPPL